MSHNAQDHFLQRVTIGLQVPLLLNVKMSDVKTCSFLLLYIVFEIEFLLLCPIIRQGRAYKEIKGVLSWGVRKELRRLGKKQHGIIRGPESEIEALSLRVTENCFIPLVENLRG